MFEKLVHDTYYLNQIVLKQNVCKLLHYTLKYGEKELTWVEQDCHELHKAKEIRLEY